MKLFWQITFWASVFGIALCAADSCARHRKHKIERVAAPSSRLTFDVTIDTGAGHWIKPGFRQRRYSGKEWNAFVLRANDVVEILGIYPNGWSLGEQGLRVYKGPTFNYDSNYIQLDYLLPQ